VDTGLADDDVVEESILVGDWDFKAVWHIGEVREDFMDAGLVYFGEMLDFWCFVS